MTGKLLETFCYDLNAPTPETLADLMAPEWLRFEVKRFRSEFQRKAVNYKPSKHIAEVRSAESLRSLDLVDREIGNRFSMASIQDWNFGVLYWELPAGSQLSPEHIQYLVELPGFNAA